MSGTNMMAFVACRCVACGSCIKTCPVKALSLERGVGSTVNFEKCTGCGICVASCPSQAIQMLNRAEYRPV